jgi:hypothetical protein
MKAKFLLLPMELAPLPPPIPPPLSNFTLCGKYSIGLLAGRELVDRASPKTTT